MPPGKRHGKVGAMLSKVHAFDWPAEACSLAAGTQLQHRAQAPEHVLHLDRGRVALGVVDNGVMTHQMGVVEGPAWLNAACAVLGAKPAIDAVADTAVQLRRVPMSDFLATLRALPAPALGLLRDLAQAHRQQAELAVSRLAKDAEARCAEWLLRHAEPAQDAPDTLLVMLHQRKRLIAAQLGIAPETLSRVLRHLRERSLISGSGRVLNLVDLNGLRAVAGV